MKRKLLKENKILMKEYDFVKNKDLDLNKLTVGSNKKIWWKCSKGHEWEALIYNRTKGKGTNCPYCSNQKVLKGYNDLATINPQLANEWDYEKNSINPDEVGAASSKKVWWKCKLGHEWEQVIEVRNRGEGCPFCNNKRLLKGFNDFKSRFPKLAEEWDYSHNTVGPDEIFAGTGKMFYWICPKGHRYKQTPNNRISNHNCPICNKEKVTSFQEKIVFYYIRKYFNDAIENYRIKELGKRELDIYIPKIKVAIEYDGGYYHTIVKDDIQKDKICSSNGIKLYRIREKNCPILNSSSICYYRKDKSNEGLEKIIKEILISLKVEKPIVDIDDDLEEIYSKVEYSRKSMSLLVVNPQLAKEWNYKKNGKLLPENVAPKSTKKVWWICNKGHEWQATINHRANGGKCPYCSNHKLLRGFNDLETVNPRVAREWNYERNGKMKPSDVFPGTARIVWWKCEKGHEWQTSVNNRTRPRGTNCPICTNMKK